MTHTDAWDGTEIEGKAIILATTEGPELIAYDQLHDHRGDVDAVAQGLTGLQASMEAALATLRGRVEELEDQLRERDVVPTSNPEPAPAAKSTAKAAGK